MNATDLVMKVLTGRAAARFARAARDPLLTQQRLLQRFVSANADTDYGRRCGFAMIRSIADFQQRVPVVDYEAIRPDMDRVVRGAQRVFTAEPPVMFAQTSGTTGEPKYVPITRTCQGRAHRDVMRTWLAHAARAHPRLFGQIVSLVSPAIEGHVPCGLPYGSTSGHMYRNQPCIVRSRYPIPYEVFEIADYQAKYYALMRLAVPRPVTFLATANPSSILKLVQKGNELAEAIVRDVRDGTLSREVAIEPRIRAAIEPRLRPEPARAQELDGLRRRRDGRLLPADYWPSLALIGCWKGGTVGHYLERFPDWFDPDRVRRVPVRDWGYLSSEFRGSIPLRDQGSAGALTVATNFYEFVRADELEADPDGASRWTFCTADRLQQDTEYYVLVTTSGGLYRYDINDVVRVEGSYLATPEIVFVRKGRGQTNITGEKLAVNQVLQAIERAARERDLVAAHFKAEADHYAARYVLSVEFTGATSDEQHRQFLLAVDRGLQAINVEYKAKRSSQRLLPPLLRVMREGWYERGRKLLAQSGKRVFQAKTVLLADKVPTDDLARQEMLAIVEIEE